MLFYGYANHPCLSLSYICWTQGSHDKLNRICLVLLLSSCIVYIAILQLHLPSSLFFVFRATWSSIYAIIAISFQILLLKTDSYSLLLMLHVVWPAFIAITMFTGTFFFWLLIILQNPVTYLVKIMNIIIKRKWLKYLHIFKIYNSLQL